MSRPVKTTAPGRIPNQPLICTPGVRPKSIPLDPYKHGDACGIDDAKKYYSEFVSTLGSGSCYRGNVDTCFEKKRAIPSMFFRYGVGRVNHAFIERIVYSLDLPALEDFRSAGVFDEVAQSPELAELVQDKREITILYPGSGSHMPPLLISLRLIDAGRIDSAKLIYTDIKESSRDRAEQYLRYLSASGRDVLKDFQKIERPVRGAGTVTEFRFTYGGKPVSLFFALGRRKEDAEEYFAPRSYYDLADVVILHDGPASGDILKLLDDLSTRRDAKRRMALSDNPSPICSSEKTSCTLVDEETMQISYRFFEGHYGCSYGHISHVPQYGMDASGRLVMRGMVDKVHAQDDEIIGSLDLNNERGGMLVDFPPKQSKTPIIIRNPQRSIVVDFIHRL